MELLDYMNRIFFGENLSDKSKGQKISEENRLESSSSLESGEQIVKRPLPSAKSLGIQEETASNTRALYYLSVIVQFLSLLRFVPFVWDKKCCRLKVGSSRHVWLFTANCSTLLVYMSYLIWRLKTELRVMDEIEIAKHLTLSVVWLLIYFAGIVASLNLLWNRRVMPSFHFELTQLQLAVCSKCICILV